MAVIYVVRHAKAGSRDRWDGEDELRPLSKNGHRQSDALVEPLAAGGASELLSSPYVRCMQTLEPLAERLGVKVFADERLAEGAAFEPALDLVHSAESGAVLCSHGDLIPDLIGALHRRGAHITTAADWRKASVWVLDRRHGKVETMAVWPPPDAV